MDQEPALIRTRFFHWATALATVLFMVSCAGVQDRYAPIPDLQNYAQSVSAHVEEDALIMNPALHQRSVQAFLDGHFAPWNREEPVHGAEDAFWGLRLAEARRFFGENKLPLGPEWLSEMRRLSDPDSFPSTGLTAVAVVNTSMRVLPTGKPAFYDFAEAGEGFPFDMMQNTAVWAGTPLYISHVSADGAWYLAECRYAFGWIHARDVGLIDRQSAGALSLGPFVTPIKDNVPLHDWKGNYLFDLRIGQILPAVARSSDGYSILVPVRDPDGIAGMVEADVSDDAVSEWPLRPKPSVIAGLADQMMGQAYGWGGLYGNRDCSSTLLDIFAAVGVPLPRNSKVQAGAGEKTDLTGLSNEEKKELILGRGVPFATLLARPGHIMLYIGEEQGEPLIFHTAWGLKTEESGGREGRKIIGQTAVTSLAPGHGVKNLARPEGVLLHKLSSMTLIGPETVAKTAPDDDMTAE